MNPTIILKFLAFLGVHKKSVLLEFNQGLNVIYGASDTGKTYILQTIDFMLGAKEIRHIPEIRGYTDILLGIEISTGEKFTLSRKASGGDFLVFDGLYKEVTADLSGKKLR
ncbi:TPA: AAA family ATPase, partial [Acinetobacter baumannii]|nr:AAA family ATPase [Acinetobacter baumannii]